MHRVKAHSVRGQQGRGSRGRATLLHEIGKNPHGRITHREGIRARATVAKKRPSGRRANLPWFSLLRRGCEVRCSSPILCSASVTGWPPRGMLSAGTAPDECGTCSSPEEENFCYCIEPLDVTGAVALDTVEPPLSMVARLLCSRVTRTPLRIETSPSAVVLAVALPMPER